MASGKSHWVFSRAWCFKASWCTSIRRPCRLPVLEGRCLHVNQATHAAAHPICCACVQAGRPSALLGGHALPAPPAVQGAGETVYIWAALGVSLGSTASAMHPREGLTLLSQGFLASPRAFCCVDKMIPQRRILSATARVPQVWGKVREIKGLNTNCSSKTRQGLCCACSECFGVIISHQLSKLAEIRGCETRKLRQYTSDPLQQNFPAANQRCT